MRRVGHKVKPTTRTSTPTVLVTVGVEVSQGQWVDSTGATPHTFRSAFIVERRMVRGRWTAPREYHRTTIAGVWDVIDKIGGKGRRPYVVAARASDTLTLLRWWERVESGECVIRRRPGAAPATPPPDGGRRRNRPHPLVIGGKPDIIGYDVGGCPFRWVSVGNWSEMSLTEMARACNYPIPDNAHPSDKWECPGWSDHDQARLMMAYMVKLLDWWRSIGGGAWKDTPGAAAWSTLLSQGGESGLIEHHEEDALKLESRAVFGGRAYTWWYGDVGPSETWRHIPGAPFPSPHGKPKPGPVHRYDVRAMYPSLLGSEYYPVRLFGHYGRISPQALIDQLDWYCAVAAVTVRSQRGELPGRAGGDVCYPVGDWHTVLTTPELLDAHAHREIVAVHEYALYQRGRPFEQWSRWVLNLRDKTVQTMGKQWSVLVKVLANSLGGRLGRRRVGWRDTPHVMPRMDWGQWYQRDQETGELTMFRSLANMVQEHVRDDHRPGTMGACFAHLTAYGRVFMSRVRAKLSRHDVLWQDTDGIVVTDRGRDDLIQTAEYHPTRFGALRYERTFRSLRYLTPKHYWADGQWVLSGIHDGFAVDDAMCSTEVMTVNPVRSAIRPDNAGILQFARHIDLSAILPGVGVDERGWATPPKRTTGVVPEKRSQGPHPLLPVEQG